MRVIPIVYIFFRTLPHGNKMVKTIHPMNKASINARRPKSIEERGKTAICSVK
jgi:hypothetical protein